MIGKCVLVEFTVHVLEPTWIIHFYGNVQHVGEHTLIIVVTNRHAERYAHNELVAIDLHDPHFRVIEAAG